MFCFVSAFAQTNSTETEKVGLTAKLGLTLASVQDTTDFIIKPGLSYHILNSGFTIGISDVKIALAPIASEGVLFTEYSFDLDENSFDMTFGHANLFKNADIFTADGYLYGSVDYAINGIDLLNFKLNTYYMTGSQAGFWLSSVIGAGYEFDVGPAGAFGLWANLNLSVVSDFEIENLATSLYYSYPLDICALTITLEPTYWFASGEFNLDITFGVSTEI